jgi:oxygen-dependent protoporphyrinogen oxidase
VSENSRVPALVVGGGISGLAAAHALHKAGVGFSLVEASSRFGGVIRSEAVDGFTLEAGPDSMLAQKPEAIALCRELGLGDLLEPTNPEERAVFILHRRRLHPLPEGMMLAVPTRVLPFLGSHLFSWPGKLRMGLDLVIPARRENGDESIASFLRRRFGEEAVARLGEPLLAGIHAGDPERLSILATFPRFAELERRYGSLVRGMWATPRPRPKPGAAPATAFFTLRGGLEVLVRALVDRLPGTALCTGRRATALARDEGGFVLAFETGQPVRARSVILALPATPAVPLVRPLLPEVAETLAGIPFASTATVMLAYRREDVSHPLHGYGMVVPETEGLRTTALSFFSTKFPGRAPDGRVLLRAFLGGMRDPQVLAFDDQALVTLVKDEFRTLLGLRAEPLFTRVNRWPGGTPQMEVGHLDRITEMDRRLASVRGLFLTGAGIRGTGIPDSVADGTRNALAAIEFLQA